MDAGVGREPQYDVFADEFLDHARGGFYNACYGPAGLPGAAGRRDGQAGP